MVSALPSRVGVAMELPMTIITAMVSPMARPVARAMLMRMPFPEAGSTSCPARYHRETPMAMEAGAYRSRIFTMVSQQEEII